LDLLQLASLLSGIVITRVLLIYRDFYSNSRGYIWKTIIKIWYILFFTIIINFTLGFMYYSLILSIKNPGNSLLLIFYAAFSGYISVIFPNMLFKSINHHLHNKRTKNNSGDHQIDFSDLKPFKVESILDFSKRLQSEVERIKQVDKRLFLSQYKWWDLKLNDDKQISINIAQKRLRFLYGQEKKDLAKSKKMKHLMKTDIDSDLSREFRILVEFFGRKELRKELLKEPMKIRPNASWFGEDRRKILGSFQNRLNKIDNYNYRLSDVFNGINKEEHLNW